jgi:hypothetical protein
MIPRIIEIDGRRYLWREIVALRHAQIAAARQAQQPLLFELIEDRRPPSQRSAASRYSEPGAVRPLTLLPHPRPMPPSRGTPPPQDSHVTKLSILTRFVTHVRSRSTRSVLRLRSDAAGRA